MTALAKDRNTPQFGTPDSVQPLLLSFPVEAATTIYAGCLVGTNASGNAVPASANNVLKLWGRAEKQVVNTVAAGYGAAGDLQVSVKPGVFYFANGDTIVAADVGKYCYAGDDQTVYLSDGAGLRPLAGVIYSVSATLGVAVGVGFASPYAINPEVSPASTANRARAVRTTNVADLTAFAVATACDGLTLVAGDVVLLVAQTTPAENGPYVVGTVGGGNAPLTRPDWFSVGSSQKSGMKITLGAEGTVFKNTTWRAFVAADSFVVGTTDGKFYPEMVSGATALVAGTFTISTVPIFGANSQVALTRKVANTSTATTGGYHPTTGGATGITAGVIGTAAAIIEACVAAGTINNADISTLHWTVINQP